jgi:hypothetical protein
MTETKNYPNAAKLMDSLRFLGYNNYSAICDIIDNALDADAQNVHITVSFAGDGQIVIADDGSGMDEHILDEALKLGSMCERNAAADLGKYGMGLVTASLSLARRTAVLTRSNGRVWKSVTDVDEVKRRNDFLKLLGPASADDIARFDSIVPKTGTVVELSKCDNIKNQSVTQFKNTLKAKLGQIYRYFLLAGRRIYVNGEQIAVRDPLMLDDRAEVYSDETFDVRVKNPDGSEVTDKIRIRIAVLPDFGSEGNKERKIGMRGQGFYILRNNREIAEAKTLGIFTRHNDLNRFRAELFFSGAFDEAMGVNFTKHEVDPSQAITDKINEFTQGQLRTIRSRIKTQRITTEDSEITHDESERLISAKSHLLIRPKVTKQAASTMSGERQGTGTARSSGSSTGGDGAGSTPAPKANVKFEAAKLGKSGPIYEAEQVGKVTVIQWNIEHPFYERFVLERKDDKTLRTSVDFLVYSLATAELTTLNEDNYEILQSIKMVISSNLRSLLS